MLELVFANLRVRPFRTLISVIGVALGVVLVILFTGLARGMTNDVAKRAANWKAEIVFTRPGGMDSMSSNAAVNIAYTAKLREIEGVSSTVPVIRYITPDNRGRWGVRQIDGVEWQPFADMNGMTIVSGRAPQANDEVIMDEREMIDNKLKVSDTYELFGGKPYKITGIFSPPSGARIKMSLAGMQEALQTDKCTYILVKLKDGADVDAVAAKINEVLPGNKINLTRDLVIDAQERIPGLNTFLRVLVVLGALVSTVFVLLSMYTTITERRKEIGILKSLGASTSFIIKVIEGEAFMIGILGIARRACVGDLLFSHQQTI
ncbi:MAG: ABC transporter permease [Chloracidobacterium sp.]|nr:ABC transporter permease [Chloracidobacterium sp.]